MAKKKSAKKKPKKPNSDQANGMEIALPEDKIKYLEAQTKSLELQLAHRVESCASTKVEYESMKQSLDETLRKYEQEKEKTVGLTRDMTRQYKGMQDDLLNKINSREKMIHELTDTLSSTRAKHQSEMEKKDETIKEKDDHVTKLNEKMEDMCSEFSSMLNGAIDQLNERIEVQGTSINGNVPIQKLMNAADYNYKSTS
jgi:chromosome segregation ATPase